MSPQYQFKVGDWVTLTDLARPDYVDRSVIDGGPVQVTEVHTSVLSSTSSYVIWDEPSGRLCPGAWLSSVVLVDGGPW